MFISIHIYTWLYTYNLVHDIFTNIYPHSFLQISKAYTGIDIHLLGFLLASSFSHRQFEDAMTEAPSYQSLNPLPRHMTHLDPQFQVAVDVVRSATKSNVTCRTFRFFRQICAALEFFLCGLNGTSLPIYWCKDDYRCKYSIQYTLYIHIISQYIPVEVACCALWKTTIRNWINEGWWGQNNNTSGFSIRWWKIQRFVFFFAMINQGSTIATIRGIVIQ